MIDPDTVRDYITKIKDYAHLGFPGATSEDLDNWSSDFIDLVDLAENRWDEIENTYEESDDD